MTEQQATWLIIGLVGGAALVWLLMSSGAPAQPAPVNLAARALPRASYENAEDWNIERSGPHGRITAIRVHRDATVA